MTSLFLSAPLAHSVYIIRGRSNIFFDILVSPRWTVEPTDKQFAQGSDAKIDCKADGFPQPKISWKKAVGKIFLLDSEHVKN